MILQIPSHAPTTRTRGADRHERLLALGLDECVVSSWLDDYDRLNCAEPLVPVWWSDLDRLHDICGQCGFDGDIIDLFHTASQWIQRNAPQWWMLLSIADRLYRADDDDLRSAATKRSRPPQSKWGELTTLFPALVYLTGLPQLLAGHERLRIPAQVTRDTAEDVPRWIVGYRQRYGNWGTGDNGGWFTNHLRLKLFALGRLEFEFSKYRQPYLVLRRSPGQLAALLEPNHIVRSDGQFASADGGHGETVDNWTSSLTETAEYWEGHAVDDRGRIATQPRRFSKNRWRVAMHIGDNVLSVHIPAGSPLDPHECAASFETAQRFFPLYFPEFGPVGFTCTSWLLDPQLLDLLGPEANLSQFLRMFKSIPVENANDGQLFERVFAENTDLTSAPRQTTLQRLLVDSMTSGTRYRSGGGLRLFRPAFVKGK